ncbi:TIGR03915 family putative DNA repair protein [uncultured Clostridium sp.]|uniref:TIGR03915 family putative DNA repair protein n=1 Tax=uncultured Clostridium sp. TaxID=59620 RepID=UPI0028E1F8FE|nr:TIGR03915 family putative DNA repair protein [uncultured Clostridium sp.]
MVVYTYDGSFQGLLTVIYEAYYNRYKPEKIIKERDYTYNFLYHIIRIENSKEKYEKVYGAMKSKLASSFINNIFLIYMSEVEGAENLILDYTKLAFKVGKDIDIHLHNPIVSDVHNIVRKVEIEKHRMLGFVRFQNLGKELYYSAIEPDYNILELIMPHFKERFKCQDFIIHDVKRNIGGIYSKLKGEWIFCNINLEDIPQIGKDDLYNELWQEYFLSVSIEERTNLKLQKRMMPKRYWKHITEVNI